MELYHWIISAVLSMTPLFELRVGIPYALAFGAPLIGGALWCIAFNVLLCPLIFVFMNFLHHLFMKLAWYEKAVGGLLERARTKIHASVEKYGYVGLMLFVAIPLPLTGAVTGALGAWILGLDQKKSFVFISLGVLIAGIIVTIVAALGIEALSIFIKKI
jgi:uncharacterized membrane protein